MGQEAREGNIRYKRRKLTDNEMLAMRERRQAKVTTRFCNKSFSRLISEFLCENRHILAIKIHMDSVFWVVTPRGLIGR
jgi:hypothetical protein